MKFDSISGIVYKDDVAPARERGLKSRPIEVALMYKAVAPARERGLKYCKSLLSSVATKRRSREGAWIEIKKPA